MRSCCNTAILGRIEVDCVPQKILRQLHPEDMSFRLQSYAASLLFSVRNANKLTRTHVSAGNMKTCSKCEKQKS